MKKLYLLLGTVLTTCLSLSASGQILISGTPYTNLTYAFAAINAGTHTGAIVIELNASFSEGAGVAMLNSSGVGAASYTSIVIRPTADNIVIDGSAQAVIHLKGADNVIIDGNNLGSTAAQRDLTIRNTSLGLGNAVVWITSSGALNAATGNSIRNCIIEGVSKTETQYGIIAGGNSFVGQATAAANNNNTIDSNLVFKCNSGIVSVGNALSQDLGWRIRANNVGSVNSGDECGYEGISLVNAVTITISHNVVAGIYGDVTQPVKGINLGQSVNDCVISHNKIHSIGNEEFAFGWGAAGLYINSILVGGNNRIYNNEIWGIVAYGNNTNGLNADYNANGIVLAQGGDFALWYNTVYMNEYPELDAPTAALFISAGVAPGAVTLMNNMLVNDNSLATDSSYAVINLANGPFAAIDYNLYYSDGPDLNYTGGTPVADLATWKALTLDDIGSVNALPPMVTAGDDVYLDNTQPSCWFANGRGLATTNLAYAFDINGIGRSTTPGTPSDIGSRDFSPATGVIPDDAIASAAPANNTTTSYYSGNHKVAEISWGPGGTVPTSVNFKYYSGVQPICWGPGVRINSYYHIAESGGAGYDYTLKIYYTEAENNAVPDAILQIVRDSTMACDWANQGGDDGIDADGRFINPSNNLGMFGNFTLGDVPLGLELLAFDAKNNGDVNDIKWTTASEKDMNNFEVLRSNDGINFSSIGSVACRNEFMKNEYSFRDAAPETGYNYYKLKINENDGRSTYSNTVAVKNGGGRSLDILSVYPNPASTNVVVSVYSTQQDNLTITVTDVTGREVLSLKRELQPGNSNIDLNISELAPGLYNVKATRGDGQVSTTKLLKQ